MIAAYESQRQPAGLPATWQVVNAAAWVGEASTGAASPGPAGEVRISAESLRGSLRRR
jgi:hypothetical protein